MPEFLRKDNALVTRFREVPSFEATYNAAAEKLRATVFGDNARTILKQRAVVLTAGAADLMEEGDVALESATIEAAF